MPVPLAQNKVKMDKRMKKLIRKRAREYNSDDDDNDNDNDGSGGNDIQPKFTKKVIEEEDKESNESFDDEEAGGQDAWNSTANDMNNDISDDEGENGDIQPGIAKFTEGCRAFRMAFSNIMKKNVSDDSLVSKMLVNLQIMKLVPLRVDSFVGSSVIGAQETYCRQACRREG